MVFILAVLVAPVITTATLSGSDGGTTKTDNDRLSQMYRGGAVKS